MNRFHHAAFRALTLGLRAYQRLFLDLRVNGRDRIPHGPKIYVTNHITSTDPYWVLPVFTEPVHVIIGPGYQSKLGARVLDAFEQINAMPEQRKSVVDKAVGYLQKGESIYTAPEGDIQPLFELGRFYPGVAKIYRRARVPIVPIALHAPQEAMREFPRLDMVVDGRRYRTVVVLRGTYFINVGEPFTPDLRDDLPEAEDNERIMDELKGRIRGLVEEIGRTSQSDDRTSGE